MAVKNPKINNISDAPDGVASTIIFCWGVGISMTGGGVGAGVGVGSGVGSGITSGM